MSLDTLTCAMTFEVKEAVIHYEQAIKHAEGLKAIPEHILGILGRGCIIKAEKLKRRLQFLANETPQENHGTSTESPISTRPSSSCTRPSTSCSSYKIEMISAHEAKMRGVKPPSCSGGDKPKGPKCPLDVRIRPVKK